MTWRSEEKKTIVPDIVIKQRQEYAKKLGLQINEVVSNDSTLNKLVNLIIWHGSLPRGSGGSRYDFDFAVFFHASSPAELLEAARNYSGVIASKCPQLTWRNDLHYDGMRMFEAHTHWNIDGENWLHIGVHLYREKALQEIFGAFDWQNPERPNHGFFRLFESWRRFCFYYRHWIYEGSPVYDPNSLFVKAKAIDYLPPTWLSRELFDVITCILQGYINSNNGICTVIESKQLALDMVAAMSYILERKPIGR
jgi:hypothetical protein